MKVATAEKWIFDNNIMLSDMIRVNSKIYCHVLKLNGLEYQISKKIGKRGNAWEIINQNYVTVSRGLSKGQALYFAGLLLLELKRSIDSYI